MKVVFFEDVEGTAQVGDVKEVKNGFARNFLLPRGIAGPTTPTNLQRANSLAQKEARRQEKLDAEASVVADKLVGYTVTIEARVGETGRLFGSVTNRDIAQRLHESASVDVEPHSVLLPEPIRELGARPVNIKFTRNISVEVTVDVVPDEESKPVVERLLAQKAAEEEAEAKRRAEEAYAAAQEAEARGETPADAEAVDVEGESEAETEEEAEEAESN
jgi:large subunit ribosomal protein L9